MCCFCPLQVLWVVAPPLLPLEKGQCGRAGSCWCLDHSERLDRASSRLPKSLPGPPQRWTQGGSQREAVALQRMESRGAANAGILRATCPGAAAVPGEAPSHARLLQTLRWIQRKKKGRGQGMDPSGSGEMFWGTPSLLCLLYQPINEQFGGFITPLIRTNLERTAWHPRWWEPCATCSRPSPK